MRLYDLFAVDTMFEPKRSLQAQAQSKHMQDVPGTEPSTSNNSLCYNTYNLDTNNIFLPRPNLYLDVVTKPPCKPPPDGLLKAKLQRLPLLNLVNVLSMLLYSNHVGNVYTSTIPDPDERRYNSVHAHALSKRNNPLVPYRASTSANYKPLGDPRSII